MADSAESTISRPTRARSQKRRASTVSPETENKLARAARSAQRLAQLSDAARDGGTLDLFPDDTARAEQQALNIDVRQGTLLGFELPDVVLAAVGAPDGVGFAAGQADAKTAARGGRGAASSKDPAAVAGRHDGQMVIDTDAGPVITSDINEPAVAGAVDSAAEVTPKPDVPTLATSLAAVSVARSVVSLRPGPPAVDAEKPVDDDSRIVNAPAKAGAPVDSAAVAAQTTTAAAREPLGAVSSDSSANSDGATASTPHPGRLASHMASPQMSAPVATPELDRARATAFADTVDALYGVISDQRRAADDHTRRMKWMLTIVVCALLTTIAIGIAQTVLLFRLSHQATSHEQRIEQMMLNQQATLATLLDTDSSTTSLPVNTQLPTAAGTSLPAAPAAPVAKPVAAHTSHAQHNQRRKSAHTH